MRELLQLPPLAACGLVCASLVLACSGPATEAPKPPDPAAVLHDAGVAIAALKSVKADVKFGPGVTLEGFTLTSASSAMQLPDQSDTTFKVKQGDFLVDVRVVSMAGHVYLRLPFSRFQELTPEQAAQLPDPARLVGSSGGFSSLLSAGKNPTYQASERLAGATCDRVSATYTAAQVGQAIGSVAPGGDVRATIWAGQSDRLPRRVLLSGPLLQAVKDVQVQMDFHDFNQPVFITNPSASPPAAAGG